MRGLWGLVVWRGGGAGDGQVGSFDQVGGGRGLFEFGACRLFGQRLRSFGVLLLLGYQRRFRLGLGLGLARWRARA